MSRKRISEAQAFIAPFHVGSLIAEHRVVSPSPIGGLILSAISLAGFIAGLILSIIYHWLQPLILLQVFCGIYFIIGLLGSWGSYRYHKLRFYICTEGVVLCLEEQPQAFRWDEIAEVSSFNRPYYGRSNPSYRENKLFIKLHNGQEISIAVAQWPILVQLADTIRERAVPPLLALAKKHFESGIPVQFGTITVSLQGISIHNGSRVLDWDHFAGTEHETISLIIKAKNQQKVEDWASISIDSLPNQQVLLALLRYIVYDRV